MPRMKSKSQAMRRKESKLAARRKRANELDARRRSEGAIISSNGDALQTGSSSFGSSLSISESSAPRILPSSKRVIGIQSSSVSKSESSAPRILPSSKKVIGIQLPSYQSSSGSSVSISESSASRILPSSKRIIGNKSPSYPSNKIIEAYQTLAIKFDDTTAIGPNITTKAVLLLVNQREKYCIKESGDYPCPVCKLKFNEELLRLHLYDHDFSPPFVCKHCKKYFVSESKVVLVKHMLCHVNFNLYRCAICGKTASSRDLLLTHISELHNINYYECPYCKKGFKETYDVRKHMETHNASPVEKNNDPQDAQECEIRRHIEMLEACPLEMSDDPLNVQECFPENIKQEDETPTVNEGTFGTVNEGAVCTVIDSDCVTKYEEPV